MKTLIALACTLFAVQAFAGDIILTGSLEIDRDREVTRVLTYSDTNSQVHCYFEHESRPFDRNVSVEFAISDYNDMSNEITRNDMQIMYDQVMGSSMVLPKYVDDLEKVIEFVKKSSSSNSQFLGNLGNYEEKYSMKLTSLDSDETYEMYCLSMMSISDWDLLELLHKHGVLKPRTDIL